MLGTVLIMGNMFYNIDELICNLKVSNVCIYTIAQMHVYHYNIHYGFLLFVPLHNGMTWPRRLMYIIPGVEVCRNFHSLFLCL